MTTFCTRWTGRWPLISPVRRLSVVSTNLIVARSMICSATRFWDSMSLPSHRSASLIQQRSIILSAKSKPKSDHWPVKESPFDSISRLAIYSLAIVRFSGSIAASCSVDTKYPNQSIKVKLVHQSLVSAHRKQSLLSLLQ